MEPHIMLDYHRVAPGGLTRARQSDVRPGVRVARWDYVVVGDDDAEPAVAQIVEIGREGDLLLRVLDGAVADNAHLLTRDRLVG